MTSAAARTLRRGALLLGLLVLSPAAARAQRWTPIGKTSSGNDVFVDPRSVKRTGTIVAADVRVLFSAPVKTPKGPWSSSRTTASFDCAKGSLAAKENVFYADAKGTKVTERTANKLPGYGPALKGSFADVALTYLCRR